MDFYLNTLIEDSDHLPQPEPYFAIPNQQLAHTSDKLAKKGTPEIKKLALNTYLKQGFTAERQERPGSRNSSSSTLKYSKPVLTIQKSGPKDGKSIEKASLRKTFSQSGARKTFVKDNFVRATSKTSKHASAIPNEIHKQIGLEHSAPLLMPVASETKLQNKTYNTIFAKTSSVDLFEQQRASTNPTLSGQTSPKNFKGGKVV